MVQDLGEQGLGLHVGPLLVRCAYRIHVEGLQSGQVLGRGGGGRTRGGGGTCSEPPGLGTMHLATSEPMTCLAGCPCTHGTHACSDPPSPPLLGTSHSVASMCPH